ncbi:Acg family FMN-binding oxidoreductase [Streptomyces sp. GQFP]|uniref:Acg family FMN-binding oxidoreductase n=1 Tax=Streptomyces sp. GQFP TaxID=2907545 RepID=UPI001F2DBCBB|nr:hypothetical protein [Streptomyces sp. GQFP]UIX34183.1 hypothetical protein LUX31_31595 [Streptomyces sp. GQFP]
MPVVSTSLGHASVHLVRAAVTAPSLYNTQPWTFVAEAGDRGLELHADVTRRLRRMDPDGREMVVSCGAALFNVRLAMRHLGFSPVVDTFPSPADPAFLARVTWGAYHRPTHAEQRMYAALPTRHTAHGPFLPTPLPSSLIDTLREHAAGEGAALHCVDDRAGRRHLAELIRVGEDAQRSDPGCAAERARWTWRLVQQRADGVPVDADVTHPDSTPFAARDYAGLARMFPAPPRRWPTRTGLAVVLSTEREGPSDWLRAGQALERILLYAASHGVMAAFHTQPLELPQLRAHLRRTLSAGEFPQMILRLGYAPYVHALPRRPATEVLKSSGSQGRSAR